MKRSLVALFLMLISIPLSATEVDKHALCAVETGEAVKTLKSVPPEQRLANEIKEGKVQYMGALYLSSGFPGAPPGSASRLMATPGQYKDYTNALALSLCQKKLMELLDAYATKYNLLVAEHFKQAGKTN